MWGYSEAFRVFVTLLFTRTPSTPRLLAHSFAIVALSVAPG